MDIAKTIKTHPKWLKRYQKCNLTWAKAETAHEAREGRSRLQFDMDVWLKIGDDSGVGAHGLEDVGPAREDED